MWGDNEWPTGFPMTYASRVMDLPTRGGSSLREPGQVVPEPRIGDRHRARLQHRHRFVGHEARNRQRHGQAVVLVAVAGAAREATKAADNHAVASLVDASPEASKLARHGGD